jgi:hypothetical protein
MAGLIGHRDWNGDDINGFIATSALPSIETSVTKLDFSGEWMCTAIGRESAHTNEIDNTASAGNGVLDTLLTFSTSNTSNCGVWDTVNFDTENLFFEDSNGPWNVGLDSFRANNSVGFKFFRLTKNTTLNNLADNGSLSFFVGYIIVGFYDNHLSNSDGDYGDIIIAMGATSVPTSGSLALFAVGLFALVFMKQKQCNINNIGLLE